MATVRPTKLAGHFRVQVFVGSDLAGKRHLRSVTICPQGCAEPAHRKYRRHDGTKRGRERLVAEIEDQLRSEAGPVITVTELISTWIAQAEIAPSTRRGYRSRLKTRITPTIGKRPIHTITTSDIAEYRNYWSGKALSPSTVNQDLAVLRSSFGWAAEHGWIASSPVTIRRAKQSARALAMPTVDAIRAVLGHLAQRNESMGLAMWLALATGARRGEVLALRWRDVDLEAKQLTIAHSLDGADLKDTKTHQVRRLPLLGDTAQTLSRWRDATERRFGRAVEPEWFICPSVEGPDRPMWPDSLTAAIAEIRKDHANRSTPCPQCGMTTIPRVWMHGLRHFSASAMFAAGIDPATVAAILGHSTVGTTLAFYAHGTEDRMAEAVKIAGSTLALPSAG